ncbi:hypothetical protein F5X99DRAFT_427570 [Biscogniauxia marginata]|nr:hypothetical protein F5X99DRAFT_427570 [Biscogniauxia marginata]
MDNYATAYSQSAEEVSRQLNSPDGKYPSPEIHSKQSHACSNDPSDKRPSSDADELSQLEPSAPSSESNRLDGKPSSATSPNESNVDHNESTPTLEQVTDAAVKPQQTVRFADDSPPEGEPQTKPKLRKFGSMTSPPVPRRDPQAPNPASSTAGKKRGRAPKNPASTDAPRKRGRPRKNPLPADTDPLSPGAGRSGLVAFVSEKRLSAKKTDAKRRQPAKHSAKPDQDPGFGPVDDELRKLVHEVFVVNTLGQDNGMSIPWAVAVQMHAVFAPGLPEPRGEVFVSADLAARIRALFYGVGEGGIYGARRD